MAQKSSDDMKEIFLSKDKLPEFVTALKGRKEIPIKFAYLREGAYNWSTLVGDKEYAIGNIETDLINKSVKKIIKTLGKKVFNLLDLGCGNGEKALMLINYMTKIHKPVNYVALDISTEMLSLAINNIKKSEKIVNTQTFCLDFERGNFAQVTDMLRKV